MISDVVLKVVVALAIMIEGVATVYAFTLIRRTKYNSIWILCIVGFTVMTIERCCQMASLSGHHIDTAWFVFFGFAISILVSAAVLLANRLVNYLDRIDIQRQSFNKRILTAVLRTEERSRLNFAKELHDGLGPLLSSAKISLSALSRTEMDQERKEIFDNTLYVVEEALRSLREISNNLSPHVLSDFGLARGIRNFIDRSQALHNVKLSFATNLRGERYNTDIEVILYRVACELVTNSLKHSGCSEIRLTLSATGDILELQYSDNGRGFNPQAMMDCGMGLSNISSRINSLNGEFDIRSSKGKGMTATVKVNVRGASRMETPPPAIDKARPRRKERKG